MKIQPMLLFLCTAFTAFAQASPACVPGTPVAIQSRTKLKHRQPPAAPSPAATTVAEMLTWSTPANIKSSKVRSSNTPIDPRENQALTVEGDLWRVEMEDNDCDFHLELTAPGGGPKDDRVIVEVPQDAEFAAQRQSILKALADAGEPFPEPEMKKSIRIRVTGFAFYDAFHWMATNPQRGKEHGTKFVGTIWELHPVWDVQFPAPAPPAP